MKVSERRHKCPHRPCQIKVVSSMFACGPHWRQLPEELKVAIEDTKFLSPVNAARLRVFREARLFWEALAAEVSDPIPSPKDSDANVSPVERRGQI